MATQFDWSTRLDAANMKTVDDINFVYFINSTFRMLPETEDQYGRIIKILLMNDFTVKQQSSILYYLSLAVAMSKISNLTKNKLITITDQWEPAWYETMISNPANPNVKYFGNKKELEKNLETMRTIIK